MCSFIISRPDWSSAKALLADPFFLEKLVGIPDSITDAQLKKLAPYVNHPEFVPERVACVSKVTTLNFQTKSVIINKYYNNIIIYYY